MSSADVEVSPSDLRFRFQLNKQLLATITISNSNNQRVAFKIKTTAPKKYVVRPSSGIVEPLSNASIQVIMQAQKEYAPEFANCKDKFMVQTTPLNDTEQIDKDTFNKDVRINLKEYRLRVTIEGPAAPPSPVPEANEVDDGVGAPPPPVSAPADRGDRRLNSALDEVATLTSSVQQLSGQVRTLQAERDDLRRQLDKIQLEPRPLHGAAPAKVHSPSSSASLSVVFILLAAIIAFLLGHYLRF